MTSAPRADERATQVYKLIEFFKNDTRPSPMRAFTPPG